MAGKLIPKLSRPAKRTPFSQKRSNNFSKCEMATKNLESLFDSSMKRPRKLLDMSKVRVENESDYIKYMDRMPDLKLTEEKVDLEDLENSMKEVTFTTSKKEKVDLLSTRRNSFFMDPIPECMQEVRMDELCAVDIHWKMLTDIRPTSKWDGDYFERLYDLGKLRKASRDQEAKEIQKIIATMPGSAAQAKQIALGFITSKSRKGTMETKLKLCSHCHLELCSGVYCKKGHWEDYSRLLADDDDDKADEQPGASSGFLKSVIAEANTGPDKKAEEKKVLERRAKKKGVSLKAMLSQKKRVRRKGKKKKNKVDSETK